MKKLFIRGAAAGVLTLGFSKIFSFLLKLIIARFGSESFGLYTTATTTFTSAVTFLAFGFPMSVTRFVSLYNGSQQKEKLNNILSSALTMGMGTGIAGTIALFAWQIHYPIPGLNTLAFVVVPAILILLIKHALFGMLASEKAYFIENFESVFRIAAISILLFLFSMQIKNLFIGYACAIVLTAYAAIVIFFKTLPQYRPKLTWSAPLYSYTWPVGISELITSLTTAGTMIYFTAISGPQNVGLYAAALSLASLIHLIPQVIMPIFFPAITTAYGRGESIWHLYRRIVILLVATLIPLTALLNILGTILINSLFGSDYTDSVHIFTLLSIAYTLYAMFVWPNRQILDMMGKTKTNMVISLIRSCIIIACCAVLVPQWAGRGYGGALLAGWFAEGGTTITVLYILKRRNSLR